MATIRFTGHDSQGRWFVSRCPNIGAHVMVASDLAVVGKAVMEASIDRQVGAL